MVNIMRHQFEELDDMALGSACFNPLIAGFKELRVQGGDEGTFYEGLSGGQQMLFIFRVYYDHVSQSIEDLYWWSAYFYAQPVKWSSLKAGMLHLTDQEATVLLHDIERELSIRNYPESLERFNHTAKDLEYDSELFNTFSSLYIRLQQAAPITIARLARYIRQHPHEFVQSMDERKE